MKLSEEILQGGKDSAPTLYETGLFEPRLFEKIEKFDQNLYGFLQVDFVRFLDGFRAAVLLGISPVSIEL